MTNLTSKQDLAITALLGQPTIAAAAKAAGISERALYNWLKEPAFQDAYRLARREAVSQAVAQLQRHAGAAAAELGKLVSGFGGVKPEIRLAAARTILEMAIKSVEIDDLQARIAALEEAHANQQ